MGANHWFPRFWGTMDALCRRKGFFFRWIFTLIRLLRTYFTHFRSGSPTWVIILVLYLVVSAKTWSNICYWKRDRILEGNGKGREMVKIVMHNVDYSPEMPSLDLIDEYFDGDWRRGKEIQRVTITHRLYQISSDDTKAWFLNELKNILNI